MVDQLPLGEPGPHRLRFVSAILVQQEVLQVVECAGECECVS